VSSKCKCHYNQTRITTGTVHTADRCTFLIISRSVLLIMKNLQTKVAEKTKTHILCSVTLFRKSCRLWDNVEKYCVTWQATDDNIIRRTHFACWITKATNTHSEYVILTSFPLQQWSHECTSLLHYTHVLMLLTWFSGFSGLEVTVLMYSIR